MLVITRRVVPTFFECTADEQAALMELVGEVKRLLDERLNPKPDGYNVGFNAGAAAGGRWSRRIGRAGGIGPAADAVHSRLWFALPRSPCGYFNGSGLGSW